MHCLSKDGTAWLSKVLVVIEVWGCGGGAEVPQPSQPVLARTLVADGKDLWYERLCLPCGTDNALQNCVSPMTSALAQ